MKRVLKPRLLSIAVLLILCSLGCGGGSAATDSYDIPEESYYEEPLNPVSGNFTQTAISLVTDMKYGWNLGNTFDAYVDPTTNIDYETSWNQPKTTQAMINGIKTAGLNTIRIPVSWHNHVNAAFTVDTAWIERVQQVVDWAIAADLYVIINIHHDNAKSWYFPDDAHAQRTQAYVKRIWKQIGMRFRNYDEHLIFEFLNEPRIVGYSNEWNWNDNDATVVEAAENINILNQLALDTIRATGGNNDKRFVMITPYVASPWAAMSSKFKVPTDSAGDKMILSVHAYTPYDFAMQSPGVTTFTQSGKDAIDSFMSSLNTKFVTGMGIPVVIGEYGATNKNNLSERVVYFTYYVTKAHSYGMCPIVWDNGNTDVIGTDYSEHYGFYKRTDQTWYFPTILTAIVNN